MRCDKRRVLFISMPICDFVDPGAQKYLFDTRSIVNLPYGLLCMCAYVGQHAQRDVEFKIININDTLVTEYRQGHVIENIPQYFADCVEQEVRQFDPDAVGISVMFNVSYGALDSIAATVKRASPKAVVIVGGNLATVIHDEIARKENIDAVCYGEGELPWLQLVESRDLAAHLKENAAFVTRASLAAGRQPVNMSLPSLDSIPPIDFRYVNLSNFNLPKLRGTVYTKEFGQSTISRILYASRGCPYNCNFCSGSNVHGKKVRYLSVDRVTSDVRQMIDRDGLNELYVCDDAFLIDKRRAKTILREFVKMKIHVSFPALLMRNIDDEVAELLAQLGNTFQYTSMESGSDFVLREIIQKPISKQKAAEAVASLRKFGISALTNIVIGSPGETDEHRRETLRTLYDIGFSWVFFMIALPTPGSRLYKQCKANGYIINESFCSPSMTKCNIRTPDYSPEHIERQAYLMNLHTNFVHNYNMRVGNYDECIVSFTNVTKSHPEQAFAYYFLAKAYEKKGVAQLALENRRRYLEILEKSDYWRQWADYFALS